MHLFDHRGRLDQLFIEIFEFAALKTSRPEGTISLGRDARRKGRREEAAFKLC